MCKEITRHCCANPVGLHGDKADIIVTRHTMADGDTVCCK